jgi:hypothetical protein
MQLHLHNFRAEGVPWLRDHPPGTPRTAVGVGGHLGYLETGAGEGVPQAAEVGEKHSVEQLVVENAVAKGTIALGHTQSVGIELVLNHTVTGKLSLHKSGRHVISIHNHRISQPSRPHVENVGYRNEGQIESHTDRVFTTQEVGVNFVPKKDRKIFIISTFARL